MNSILLADSKSSDVKIKYFLSKFSDKVRIYPPGSCPVTVQLSLLQAGKCTLELGFIYNDCINNFERVADHCSNLAITVLEETGNQVHPHDYLMHLKDDNGSYQEQFNNWFEHYCGALKPIK